MWTFWIQICSDYHLNSIYNYYCCIWLFGFVMSLCMPYGCIVSLREFACISTWALLGILNTYFINEPQIDKVPVYLVIFTTAL